MRLLCAFAKLHGYDYLRQLVKPLLDKMCDLTLGNSFILDSTLAAEEEIADNQETIKFFAQAFLNIVCNSASGMPL
jgi:neurofibromin 1